MISTDCGLCSRLDVGPCSHVLVLLLHPDQLCVAVLVCHVLHNIEGEGRYLLDGVNCNFVLESALLPCLDEVVVHLSGAEEHLLDPGGVLSSGSIVDNHSLELSSRLEVVEAGPALRQPQQGFRSHQHQGFAEGQGDLSAENVAVVGRVGAVGNDHVDVAELLDGEIVLLGREVLWVVGAQLEETLRTGGAVLRTHTLI